MQNENPKEKFSNSIADILSGISGGDVFVYLAEKLCQVFNAKLVFFSKGISGSEDLGIFAWNREEIELSTYPFDKSSFTENPIEFTNGCFDKIPLDIIRNENIEQALLYGLKDSLGDVSGIIGILGDEHFQIKNAGREVIEVLLPLISREIEKLQLEEIVLNAASEIDIFNTALKNLNSLSSTTFKNIPELFSEYVKSGCNVFMKELGAILRFDEGKLIFIEVQDSTQFLERGKLFQKEDSIFNEIINAKSSFTGEISFGDNKDYLYMACPLLVNNILFGCILFACKAGSEQIKEFELEILDIIGKSISSEMEKRNAYDEIFKLKQQQDGDYFLTSLLLKPLMGRHAKSEKVSVDILVEQKKKFNYKKWTEEIGGDLCIAHTISLKNKKYTAFLNSDAMGKSIQGAGGALVIGAVYQSLIIRTQQANVQKLSPEEWLHSAYIELQTLFETFDGSMLISVVMGLLHDETGIVYYLNAEHPWSVLYRDGVACFIENELFIRKLGTVSDDNTKLGIRTLKLLPDDCLIIGSDGRDDILFHAGIDSPIRLNSDENFFLRMVEEGNGELKSIYESTIKRGKITDDFSLMRIHYHGEKSQISEELNTLLLAACEKIKIGNFQEGLRMLSEIETKNPQNPVILKKFAKVYYQLGRYNEAIEYILKTNDLNNEDNEFLFFSSKALKRFGNIKESFNFSYLLYLRDPSLVENLKNLSELYGFMGDKISSERILKEAKLS